MSVWPTRKQMAALRKRALDHYRPRPGEKSFGQRIKEIVERRDREREERDRKEPDAWWFA